MPKIHSMISYTEMHSYQNSGYMPKNPKLGSKNTLPPNTKEMAHKLQLIYKSL